MSRRLVPAAARFAAPRSCAVVVALIASIVPAGGASAASGGSVDRFTTARTDQPTLRTDGERFAAWQRPGGMTVIFDARRPSRLRSVRTPAGARLAAVGGGRVIWELSAAASQPHPSSSSLVAADADGGQPGRPVSFVATYGSGPLCPQPGASYAGITGAGTAGVIVTCSRAASGRPWRFSVDPASGASTAPRFAPAELAGRVWDWNADAAGIQVLACDTVARAPVFADAVTATDDRGAAQLAYESPFGAASRWDGARRTTRPGAQLVTCGRSRPTVLERSGAPSGWQFGGTELSWVTARRDRRGHRTRTANLYDLRRGQMRRQVRVRLTRGMTMAAGHVGARLLVQTTVAPSRKGRRTTSTVRSYRAR